LEGIKMKVAVYPGSFDPITNGHLDIIYRAAKIFDKVIVLVAINPNKKSRFTPEERVEMIKETIKQENIEIDLTTGLTVKYAKEHGATHLIRGLRAVTDFEYEFQLANANEYIDKTIDSVFLMSRAENSFINSSMIVELHNSGVDVSHLVPESVMKRLNK
jgi:pantetheine-phosphate adenylyltransferase